jgi:hypothetical protein
MQHGNQHVGQRTKRWGTKHCGTKHWATKHWATKHWAIALVAAALLPLSACGGTPEETVAHAEHAKVEPVEGSELARVTLTAKAAERLGIKTEPVRQAKVPPTPDGRGAPVQRMVVPYGAVFYDRSGDTWAYTSPQSLVFIRHKITVDYIDGQRAVLSAGPPAGTPVVTVGATELFGAEVGVDH